MDEKDFERAEMLTQIEINSGIARSRRLSPAPEGWDGKTCSECEIPLPVLRLRSGLHNCVECQTRKEKRERLGLK